MFPVDECVFFFAFYTEVQDDSQKSLEINFREKSPIGSEDTLRVKNFVEIEINAERLFIPFFILCQTTFCVFLLSCL